jgi:hypothetical protein
MPPSLGFVEGVAQPLEKNFEVIKDVGDGSFGSVVLARVRGTRNMVIYSPLPLPPLYVCTVYQIAFTCYRVETRVCFFFFICVCE